MEFIFGGKKRSELSDNRAIFVNKLCQYIWDKQEGSYDYMAAKISDIWDDCQELIRNVYETDSEIPLVIYHRLYTLGKGNWGWSEEAHNLALNKAWEQCINYYGCC